MASVSNIVSEDNHFTCTAQAFLPATATVPLIQTDDSKRQSLTVLVNVGDTVEEGQELARGEDISVHASVPGVVTGLQNCEYPNGRQGEAAIIALSGAFSYTGRRKHRRAWEESDDERLCECFSRLGVVNTFCGCKSLAKQLRSLHAKSARLLVVRLFDDDPTRVVERFLAVHETEKLTEGIAIIARAMRASGVVIAYAATDKKSVPPLALEQLSLPAVAVRLSANEYPVGFETDLALAIKKQCKEEPYQRISARDVYIDAMTAISAYEAVVLSMPVMERYVHISGDCIRASAILRAKLGTSLEALAQQCGGFIKPPARVIVNGLLTGNAINSLQIPLTKQVKSITFQSAAQVELYRTAPCIRCGNCRGVCPMQLSPDVLLRAFTFGEYAADSEKLSVRVANLCTQCGLCNAVCPSRLPLSQTISLLQGASA